VALTRELRDECTVFVGKLQIKRPLGRPRRRWDLKEIGLREGGVAWTGLV